MPELPEVETIRRALLSLEGQRMEAVLVIHPGMVKRSDPETFRQSLEGKRIDAIDRRGKYLLFRLDDHSTLLCHLMMAGRLWLNDPGDPILAHTHVRIFLSSGKELRYQDLRHFGGFTWLKEGDPGPQGLATMGPEPFDPQVDEGAFHAMLKRRKATLKGTLLDQSFMAGLGNIYVDEALFEAALHPETPAFRVNREGAGRLLLAIRNVLDRGIRHRGTTFGTYTDVNGRPGENAPTLQVFRRQGQPCLRCGEVIRKVRVAGRGTHVCPNCQRQPKGRSRPWKTSSSNTPH